MVERVARGKLVVPAFATLSLIATGMVGPEHASAASRDTTLQIRVQVVERCQITVSTFGRFAQSCGGGGIGTPLPSFPVGEIVGTTRLRPAAIPSFPPQGAWPSDPLPTLTRVDIADQANRANRRARDIAESIAKRVRYITIAY